MKRLLLLLPLLAVPPALVAGYFLYLAPPSVGGASEIVGTPDSNLQAARTAAERAGRFLRQARVDSDQELLQQAVVQYRVCLAYETAGGGVWGGSPPHTSPTDAVRLFEEARHNLEASRLLLVQQQRPVETRIVCATPAPVLPKPIARGKSKPPPSATEITAVSRNGEAAPKPLLTEEEVSPVKATSVGPDGITFEPVDKGMSPR